MLEQLNLPAEVKICLTDLTKEVQAVLGQNLIGIYVHGSIAMDCFKPTNSDIDILIVIENKLSLAMYPALYKVFNTLVAQYQQRLELSIIQRATLVNFVHPTPFELHFSEEYNQFDADNPPDLAVILHDADLAGHFVITRKFGITLTGELARNIFPEIPRAAYFDSIRQDTQWSIENVLGGPDEGNCIVPKYAVLNFCRVLAFRQKDLITSKQTGGEWGLANLPAIYHSIIQVALQEYELKDSSSAIDCLVLKQFAHYVQTCLDIDV